MSEYDYSDFNILQLDPLGGTELRTGFIVSLRSSGDFREEPAYTRTRTVRYDNYRSSQSNLEMQQFWASVKKLSNDISNNLADVKTMQTLYDGGGTLPSSDISISWNSPVVYEDPPTNNTKDSSYDIGYQTIISRLASLEQRIENIENGRL